MPSFWHTITLMSVHQEGLKLGSSQSRGIFSILCGCVYHENALFPGCKSQSWLRNPWRPSKRSLSTATL